MRRANRAPSNEVSLLVTSKHTPAPLEINFVPFVDFKWQHAGIEAGVSELIALNSTLLPDPEDCGDDESDLSYIPEDDLEDDTRPRHHKKGYTGVKPCQPPTVHSSGFYFTFLNGYVCESDDNVHVNISAGSHWRLHDCCVLAIFDQFYWPDIGILCKQHDIKHIVPMRN
jgi:hypothetical protein